MLLIKISLLIIHLISELSAAFDAIAPSSLPVTLPKCDNSNGIHMNFSNTGIQRIPNLTLSSAQVTCMSLECNVIDKVESEKFQNFSQLQYLNLRNNKISNIDKLLGSSFPALKTLILDKARFGDESIRYYHYENLSIRIDVHMIAPRLEKLYLRFNNFQTISMNEIANIKELYLNNNHLREFIVYENRPCLTHLHLADNRLTSLYLKYFPNLEELVLDNNQITRIGNDHCYYCDSLHFEGNHNLKKLSIKRNRLYRIAFYNLKSLISLKYLDLSSNQLTYVPEDEFTHLISIQILLLNNNHLKYIPNFSSLRNLVYLHLNDNEIDEIRYDVFKNLPKLKLLKISDNKIREIAAGTFDEMPNLEELDLSKNKLITCANGWISLMSSLRILQLNDNKFENGESISLNGIHTDLQYINLLDNPFENLTVRSIMFLPPRAVIDLKHGDDSSCHDDILVDNDVNQHLDVCR